MKRITGIAATLVALLAALLLFISAQAKDAARQRFLFPTASYAPVVIEPQSIPEATPRLDQQAVGQRLAEAATTQLQRSLTARRMAAQIAVAPSPSVPHLSVVVRLPLALPVGVIGLRAHDRKGIFATATVTLRDRDGANVEATAQLKWSDVRWLRGGRIKRNRALDDVLTDFARKAVDRAVQQFAVKQRGVLHA